MNSQKGKNHKKMERERERGQTLRSKKNRKQIKAGKAI